MEATAKNFWGDHYQRYIHGICSGFALGFGDAIRLIRIIFSRYEPSVRVAAVINMKQRTATVDLFVGRHTDNQLFFLLGPVSLADAFEFRSPVQPNIGALWMLPNARRAAGEISLKKISSVQDRAKNISQIFRHGGNTDSGDIGAISLDESFIPFDLFVGSTQKGLR